MSLHMFRPVSLTEMTGRSSRSHEFASWRPGQTGHTLVVHTRSSLSLSTRADQGMLSRGGINGRDLGR